MRSLRFREGRWLTHGKRASAGSDFLTGCSSVSLSSTLRQSPNAHIFLGLEQRALRTLGWGEGKARSKLLEESCLSGSCTIRTEPTLCSLIRELDQQNRPQSLLFDQDQLPYSLKAFRLRIDFPREYPLKPPTLTFTTKIYHPNISEDGLVCLPLISTENWKPYTKTYQGRVGLAQKRGRWRRGLLDRVVVGLF